MGGGKGEARSRTGPDPTRNNAAPRCPADSRRAGTISGGPEPRRRCHRRSPRAAGGCRRDTRRRSWPVRRGRGLGGRAREPRFSSSGEIASWHGMRVLCRNWKIDAVSQPFVSLYLFLPFSCSVCAGGINRRENPETLLQDIADGHVSRGP